MALSKIDVANMLTGATPVANGGTALTSGFKNGVTSADMWRLTTTFTGDASPVSSNLESADTYGQGKIGSAMTVSSGIWTFPSTGIWQVIFGAYFSEDSANRAGQHIMQVTTDNSSYNDVCYADTNIADHSAVGVQSSLGMYILDVTNTTNVKCRFNLSNVDDSTSVVGSSNHNQTYWTFIRLGDT
jgi:hypothetical protein|tara:strand:- start:137 stop:694 length:558 start_codon:yes stop_codon:yes gene_type:complete